MISTAAVLAASMPGEPFVWLLLAVSVLSAVLLPVNLTLIRSLSRSDRLIAQQSSHDGLKAITRATAVFTATLAALITAMIAGMTLVGV